MSNVWVEICDWFQFLWTLALPKLIGEAFNIDFVFC